MAANLANKHPQAVSLVKDLEGNAQATLAFNAGVKTGALAEGIYELWADQDCYIKVGPTPDDVTSSTGYLLLKTSTPQAPVPILVRNGSLIGCIKSTNSGTLSYHRVG